ncbi:MAG: hypothetical protein GY938_06225 [Ketobacter sp.]|nr:hypothetical protein [Ketobacter sp.]
MQTDTTNNTSLILPTSRFRREFNSLIRKLSSSSCPLKKVIITRSGKRIAVVYDQDSYEGLASVKGLGLVLPAAASGEDSAP